MMKVVLIANLHQYTCHSEHGCRFVTVDGPVIKRNGQSYNGLEELGCIVAAAANRDCGHLVSQMLDLPVSGLHTKESKRGVGQGSACSVRQRASYQVQELAVTMSLLLYPFLRGFLCLVLW